MCPHRSQLVEPMEIRSFSPHLAFALSRITLDGDEEIIRRALEISFASGGWHERDFTRKEGSSYNPRPARLALILLDVGERRTVVLAAAVLLPALLERAELLNELLDEPHLLDVANGGVLRDAASILRGESRERCKHASAAVRIAAAEQLDRARHLHLADGTRSRCPAPAAVAEVLERTVTLIGMTESLEPRIHRLLAHWYARFAGRWQR